MQIHPALYVSNSKFKGRAVFTAGDIPADSIIEVSQVIVIPEQEKVIIHDTVLHDYYFDWPEDGRSAAIALGYVSLYNHSNDPNADYEMNYEDLSITIRTKRDIKPGEEITISYIDIKSGRGELWFDTRN